MDPTSTSKCTEYRGACIVAPGTANDLVITKCYIDAPGDTESEYGLAIALNDTTNLTITECAISNSEVVNLKGSFGCIEAYTLGGVLNISNNQFNFTTDGYVFVLGHNANNCTEINIIENVFDGNAANPHTATLQVKKVANADLVINVIGNKFQNFYGNTFSYTGDVKATFNSKYNSFDENSKFKFSTMSSCEFVAEGNYYAAEQTHTTTDYGTVASEEARAAAYAAYKATK